MRVALLFGLCMYGLSLAEAAEEHCLVVGAMARAGYDARMQLLVGTDPAFDAAYRVLQADSKRVGEKYRALMRDVDRKNADENPEGHGGSFKSEAERNDFFRRWSEEVQALEGALGAQIAASSSAFDSAISSKAAPATRIRVARISAQWTEESKRPCYWGPPK